MQCCAAWASWLNVWLTIYSDLKDGRKPFSQHFSSIFNDQEIRQNPLRAYWAQHWQLPVYFYNRHLEERPRTRVSDVERLAKAASLSEKSFELDAYSESHVHSWTVTSPCHALIAFWCLMSLRAVIKRCSPQPMKHVAAPELLNRKLDVNKPIEIHFWRVYIF